MKWEQRISTNSGRSAIVSNYMCYIYTLCPSPCYEISPNSHLPRFVLMNSWFSLKLQHLPLKSQNWKEQYKWHFNAIQLQGKMFTCVCRMQTTNLLFLEVNWLSWMRSHTIFPVYLLVLSKFSLNSLSWTRISKLSKYKESRPSWEVKYMWPDTWIFSTYTWVYTAFYDHNTRNTWYE